jgi:glycosyltransferase involved in cell wall biosynthesis
MSKKKPGILLVGNFLSSTGSNRSPVEELELRLSEAGYPVVTASAVRSRLGRLADMLFTCYAKRNIYQVAYLEVYSGPAFLWAEWAGRLLSAMHKPFILTLHGGNLPEFARRWPGRMRGLLSRATVVTAPSGYLAEALCPYRQDIRVLPNPIEISFYQFYPRTDPSPRIVWLRAFHSIYNPELAPKVIALLAQEFPELRLRMVGPDKGDGSLQAVRQSAEELDVTEHIAFPGGVPKNQVPQVLAQADIFLNTTNIDNTPISVIEAMACGLCIVSTKVGGIPYLLEDEKDALLVPSDDAEAMAQAVRRILTESGLAERLSRNARAKAEQFDWPVILTLWEQLFSEGANA